MRADSLIRSISIVMLVFTIAAFQLPDAARSFPQTQDPTSYILPVLTHDEIRDLIPTPAAPPDVGQLPTALPTGDPVNKATEAAIREAISNFYACANAGMPVETITLFSSRFLSLPEGGSIELDFSATVTPLPEPERAEIVAVWNIQRLADGRVAATVTVGGTFEGDRPRTLVMIFFRDNDRWLIDELVTAILRHDQRIPVADAVGSPPIATPEQ